MTIAITPSGVEDRWQEIWQKKGTSAPAASSLLELLAVDGYDTAASAMEAAAWCAYVDAIADRLEIAPSDDVCEIGCGAGAFLFPLAVRGIRLWGVDYASSLVAICRNALPTGTFEVAEASQSPFASERFDVVVSSGAFIYFRDLAYADAVVGEVARTLKRGGRAAILDVNDASRRDTYVAIKRAKLGTEEYERAYSNSPHLFYERDWFFARAGHYGLSCVIEDQAIEGYANSPFRFNVFLAKGE